MWARMRERKSERNKNKSLTCKISGHAKVSNPGRSYNMHSLKFSPFHPLFKFTAGRNLSKFPCVKGEQP